MSKARVGYWLPVFLGFGLVPPAVAVAPAANVAAMTHGQDAIVVDAHPVSGDGRARRHAPGWLAAGPVVERPVPSANGTVEGPTAVGVPGRPRGLAGKADGGYAVDLSWNAPADTGSSAITGYLIEMWKGEVESWIVVGNTTATMYKVTGLKEGSGYAFLVRATNASGAGSPSRWVEVTTEHVTPGEPGSLRSTADGDSAIDLSWAAPSDTGTSAISGYRIEVWDELKAVYVVLVENTGSVATTYRDAGLQPKTVRYYRVSAINTSGPGAWAYASATTEGMQPGAPRRLRATVDGDSTINLSWIAPADAGTSAISGYRIYVWDWANSVYVVLVENTGSAAATTYRDTGVQPNTTRWYRVRAINASGAGLFSGSASATTEPAEGNPPGVPTGLTATADGDSAIDLSWAAPSDTGTSAINGYGIEVSIDAGTNWSELVANTRKQTTTYRHTLATTGIATGVKWFHYRVSAINASGAGDASNAADATREGILPGAPTGLTATADGDSAIDLSWTAPFFPGNSAITGYRVEVSGDRGTNWSDLEANTGTTVTTYRHAGLQPDTALHYRVSAVNASGAGAPSNVAAGATEGPLPGAPTELVARVIGDTTIELSWTAPSDTGTSAIGGYRIEVSSDGGDLWNDLVANTNSPDTRYRQTGLSVGTTLHYRVSAVNASGAGPPSNVASATTGAAPGAPTGLAAAADGPNAIDLSWAAPAHKGASAITGYRIDVSSDGGDSWEELLANTASRDTTYRHAGLAPGTTRHYRVFAMNDDGVSAPSNVADATTGALVPDPPTDLVATPSSPTRIDLAWRAPGYDGGAPLTGYRVEVSEDGTAWTDLERTTGNPQTEYSHEGLQPGSTRHYRVSAINSAGTSPPSGVASATTDDPVARADRVNRAVLPYFAGAMSASITSSVAGRAEAAVAGRPAPSGPGAARLGALAAANRDPGLLELFDSTSFAADGAGGVTMWGTFDHRVMGRAEGSPVRWDGSMYSAHLGADVRIGGFLAGVAGSRSSGSYDFTDATGGRDIQGTYEARMTGVTPYLAWMPGHGFALWVAGTKGWGNVTVDDSLAGARSSDARMTTGAFGGSRQLLGGDRSALKLRAEAWRSQVVLDGGEGMDSLTLGMRRGRLAMEWNGRNRFAGGHMVAVLLEGGMRYDAGDGPEGSGFEVGGGLRYSNPSGRVTVESRGRMLVSSEYEEWGAEGSVRFAASGETGLAVRLAPSWGSAASGVQRLWDQARGRGAGEAGAGRVNARVEYRLPSAVTPYGRFSAVGGMENVFATGIVYKAASGLDMSLEGMRAHRTGSPRQGLTIGGRWRF